MGLRRDGVWNPTGHRHVEKQDSSREESAVDPPKETRETALRDGPVDEVVETLSDPGHGHRAGKLDVVEGSSPERRLGDAPAREAQHRTGDVDSEDVIPRGRDGLREDPAPATEIDDESVLEPRALQSAQENRSGAPRDLSETSVMDVGEVLR